eukprot:gene45858-47858_t
MEMADLVGHLGLKSLRCCYGSGLRAPPAQDRIRRCASEMIHSPMAHRRSATVARRASIVPASVDRDPTSHAALCMGHCCPRSCCTGQIASMEAKESERKDGSTAWNNTSLMRDELCVRFVIEEGKTNLMLRCLVRFKEWHYEQGGRSFDQEQQQRVMMFETGMSLLLRHTLEPCWGTAARHAALPQRGREAEEALQTIDITLLLEHIQR